MSMIKPHQLPVSDEYGEVEGSLESGLSHRKKVPSHELTSGYRRSSKHDYSQNKGDKKCC